MTSYSPDKDHQDHQKLDQIAESWTLMIANISHDILSPLASLRLIGESLEEVFPELVKNYQSTSHSMTQPTEQKRQLKALPLKQLKMLEERLIPNIQNAITNIMDSLNILPFYAQKLRALNSKKFSAQEYLSQLLAEKNNAFTPSEKALIHLNFKEDFYFSCDPIFAKSLLNNLLRNALSAIKDTGRGEIFIWSEQANNQKFLHIKDTACGLEPLTLERIFNRFFSKNQREITPGLGLCKLALLHSGADISCRSIRNEYTEFLLSAFD